MQLSVSPLFEGGVILAIFLNTLVLAIYNYDDRDNDTEFNQLLESCGSFFTVLFAFECVTKIIAMGFVMHRNSYLRDYWNWLDILVVVIGVIELTPLVSASWIKSLRVLRVLRPLKTIKAFPSMRNQI